MQQKVCVHMNIDGSEKRLVMKFDRVTTAVMCSVQLVVKLLFWKEIIDMIERWMEIIIIKINF